MRPLREPLSGSGGFAAGRRRSLLVATAGERLWDGLEELEERFNVEAVSSPSGVTHLTLTRR
jgi:hypothetical protein